MEPHVSRFAFGATAVLFIAALTIFIVNVALFVSNPAILLASLVTFVLMYLIGYMVIEVGLAQHL